MRDGSEEDRLEAEGPARGRMLWPRFSLAVAAFLLLLLSQGSFGILLRGYSETFSFEIGPLVGFLAFGIAAGFAFGLAVVLPARPAFRHPRRGLALAILPLLVTALNVFAALEPTALPQGLTDFTFSHLVGLQAVASVLLGVAAASAVAD